MSVIAYANLTIDGQSLLLPQTDVQHIALADNIRQQEQDTGILGSVEHDGHEWPVFALSRDLSPLDTLPEQRRLVACITDGEQILALACDMLTTVRNEAEHILDDLPEMMHLHRSPIRQLLYSDGVLHYVSGAAALIDYLLDEKE